jgi:hypothetical protein
MERNYIMKIFGGIAVGLGFLLIAGTAGSSDFYEECRAAADCVAGEPMSLLQMILQCVGGVILIGVGALILADD